MAKVRTTVTLDEEVLRWVTVRAARLGRGDSQVIEDYMHTILLDGQVIGHWKHTPRSRGVVVETAFYRRFTAAEERALDATVDRFGRFMGVPATWQ